jgi:hypothetical protein
LLIEIAQKNRGDPDRIGKSHENSTPASPPEWST